jgi:phosphoglycolate phosphatase-like HAD superfamily hydrolase
VFSDLDEVRLPGVPVDALRNDAVMVGDSVTDVEVSQHVGIQSIGYAKTRQRGIELALVGARVIITDMALLGSAVRVAADLA